MRRAIGIALAALVAALSLEGGAAMFTAQLERDAELYVPQAAAGYEAYLKARDPIVGWPPPGPKKTYSRFGACAAVFGSTLSSGAGAYPETVGAHLDCYVANHSFEGYGTDQAFLRYRDVEHTDAPIVVLAHDSNSLARNLNHFRGYLDGSALGLKPRFVFAHDGTLTLLQLPKLSAKDYARLASGDDGPLPQEYWDRPPMRTFPYAFTALAWLRGKRLGAELHDEDVIRALYDVKHESWVSSLTLALMQRFAITARERGQKPLVAIIPDEGSLRALKEGRALPYAAFERELRAREVEVIAIAEPLSAAGEVDALYASSGALSERGHAAIGALVAKAIEQARKTQ